MCYSFFRITNNKSARRDSNPRPSPWQGDALPTEPLAHRFGNHLLSQAVSSQVPSAALVLTYVFGMGTGVSLKRIVTKNI